VRQPDIEKARNVMNWEPQYDRSEGLRKTLDYFKKAVMDDE